MKKKLGLSAAFIAILCFAAIVFAEDTRKKTNERPPRPSVKTQRPDRAPSREERNSKMQARGLEAMIQRETKRIETEVARVTKAHEEETALLKTIQKQANEEKAKKTAALIAKLIETKNSDNKAKIEKIKSRIENIKKRMQRSPRQPGQRQPGQRGPQRRGPGARPTRSVMPRPNK